MDESWFGILAWSTALGCALIGGVFFAFSSFVMAALARLAAPQGIAAMQSINVVAVTPLFMAALFGTAAGCLLLTVSGSLVGPHPGARYLMAGGLCYLVGTIGVTIVCNVPWNNRLAVVTPAGAESARLWSSYVRSWTAWNHLRTVMSLVAAALIATALLQP
jgi:uncharacterized membrane protein